MSKYTLTYAENVQGWASFYSFFPEKMIGMNNLFYSFKGGNLYRHNANNENRNTFYKAWWQRVGNPDAAFVPSSIQSVLNQAVLENKLYKTIDIQGDATWDIQLETDLQNSGYIFADYFEKKEATYFAFIRNTASGQLSLRSVTGIGNNTVIAGGGTIINFSISPLVSIGNIISVGDYIYYGTSNPKLAGAITSIEVNLPLGVNRLIINNTIPGAVPIVGAINYFFTVKNSVAESHGVLGHYCIFTMQNSLKGKIELFTVGSDVMKSYP
jgi:hypothetical protein